MPTRFIKRAVFGAAGAAAMLLAGTAQASLQDRDLDGNGVTDAFYDTDLNITWLRDANVNGPITWDSAVSWADAYGFGGYSDWRLPTSDTCVRLTCTGSEMGHLWYSELGNLAGGPMTNTGNFLNLQADEYWSGTHYAPNPDFVYAFNTYSGFQSLYGYTTFPYGFYAMAVRPGDVAAVPEPQTHMLLMLGLTGLAVAIRRRPY